MNNSKNVNVTAKLGPASWLLGIFLVVFVVLKLCGVIAWSWFLVLLPLWIMLAGWILCFAVFAWFFKKLI